MLARCSRFVPPMTRRAHTRRSTRYFPKSLKARYLRFSSTVQRGSSPRTRATSVLHTCYVLSLLTFTIFYGIVLFPFTFAFRYYVIKRYTPSRTHVFGFCVLIALVRLYQLAAALTSETDPEHIVAYMKMNAPCS
ncbi:hypothetical protein L596_019169 [Steinernema carpocapsae]|uniref:Uncharacterized protein n=1 Tax=Steinernema carpocapsae TaxID=34508 RepID=A0A4U5N7M4_STECR|nr:hypothetical protein L596_019169 [Steinernema carpocapsae]